ncbi:glycosyltransferase family 2 protein [Oceanidesulfovibrio marinus]|uniref:Glycosyltransferase n=1 Tax=Oceanidesulfovibrio marinus TaxID=370038 RepID=A0A6P1ZL93_9BACT|nr:glycosyltransferase family 2 protein [Oceanidesulfovibrio marinus]TVM36080.1 glycosyltransferase [Oceanidesulfovibrio marinus]
MEPKSTNAPLKATVVVPVFNEENVISIFLETIEELFKARPDIQLEILFVNDGSTDATLARLIELQDMGHQIRIIDLGRNFGKEAALAAGLHHATGQVVIPIDVDLQDDPKLIFDMIEKWREGYEVVLGRRIDRSTDTRLKRVTANAFYYVHNLISQPKISSNVGDFRLMDRKVVEAFRSLPESRRFSKGLFAWVGFRSTYVDYSRTPRVAGCSKFNGWKLWNFALEGFTSFSTAPLRFWTYFGLGISLTSFLYALLIITKVLIRGIDVPGYASLIVAIMFFGGLQLMGIGILGEYLGRTYIESKRRPIFIVREAIEPSKNA